MLLESGNAMPPPRQSHRCLGTWLLGIATVLLFLSSLPPQFHMYALRAEFKEPELRPGRPMVWFGSLGYCVSTISTIEPVTHEWQRCKARMGYNARSLIYKQEEFSLDPKVRPGPHKESYHATQHIAILHLVALGVCLIALMLCWITSSRPKSTRRAWRVVTTVASMAACVAPTLTVVKGVKFISWLLRWLDQRNMPISIEFGPAVFTTCFPLVCLIAASIWNISACCGGRKTDPQDVGGRMPLVDEAEDGLGLDESKRYLDDDQPCRRSEESAKSKRN